jgi:hypothetical protein
MKDSPDNALQAVGNTVSRISDRECLESWARHRDADSLQVLVERYLVFVHSSALRRTGDAAQAAEVTRAVFLVLADARADCGRKPCSRVGSSTSQPSPAGS